MITKKEYLDRLREKVSLGAECCTPRYYCNACPYRTKIDCYGALISNMVYLVENDPAFGRKVENEKKI